MENMKKIENLKTIENLKKVENLTKSCKFENLTKSWKFDKNLKIWQKVENLTKICRKFEDKLNIWQKVENCKSFLGWLTPFSLFSIILTTKFEEDFFYLFEENLKKSWTFDKKLKIVSLFQSGLPHFHFFTSFYLFNCVKK